MSPPRLHHCSLLPTARRTDVDLLVHTMETSEKRRTTHQKLVTSDKWQKLVTSHFTSKLPQKIPILPCVTHFKSLFSACLRRFSSSTDVVHQCLRSTKLDNLNLDRCTRLDLSNVINPDSFGFNPNSSHWLI